MALVLTQLVVESRVAQMRVSAGIAPRIFKRKPDSRRIHLSAVDRVERSTISFKNYSAVLPIALLSITIRQRNAKIHESGRRENQDDNRFADVFLSVLRCSDCRTVAHAPSPTELKDRPSEEQEDDKDQTD